MLEVRSDCALDLRVERGVLDVGPLNPDAWIEHSDRDTGFVGSQCMPREGNLLLTDSRHRLPKAVQPSAICKPAYAEVGHSGRTLIVAAELRNLVLGRHAVRRRRRWVVSDLKVREVVVRPERPFL